MPMRSRKPIPNATGSRGWASLLGVCAAVSTLSAADTNTPPAAAVAAPLSPEQMFEGGTNAYNNWMNVAAGGFITTGNKAQAQQRHQYAHDAFGGIEDFHYQGNLDKITALS